MSIVSRFLQKSLGIPEIDLIHPSASTAADIAQGVVAVTRIMTQPVATPLGTVITEIAPSLIAEIDGKVETAVRGALARYGVSNSDADAAVSLIENELAVLS